MSDLLNIAVEFSSVQSAVRAIGDLQRETTLTGAALEKSIASWNGYAAAASTAIAAGQTFVSTIIETTVQMDRMNKMMQYASDYVQVGGKGMSTYGANMAFVSKTADELGLSIMGATTSFAKLTAATKDTALEGEKARNIFIALSAVNSQLGGSAADLNGIMKAVTDMISKGTVQLEELKGQLGDRLPGALNIAATAMNKTTSELLVMISNGEVAAVDFLPKLAKALYITAEDVTNMQNKIKSLSEEQQNSVVSVKLLTNLFGENMPNVLKLYAQSLGITTEELKKQIDTGNLMVKDMLPNLNDQLGKVDTTFNTMASSLNRLDNAWIALKQSLADNSWAKAIVDGAGTAIGALAKLMNYRDEIRKDDPMRGKKLQDEIDLSDARLRNPTTTRIANAAESMANAPMTFINNAAKDYGLQSGPKQSYVKPDFDLEAEKKYNAELKAQKKQFDEEMAAIDKAASEKKKNEADNVNAQELKRFQTLNQHMEIETLRANAKSVDDKRKRILAEAEVDKQAAADEITRAKLSGENVNKAVELLYQRKLAIDAKAREEIAQLDQKDATKAENKAEREARKEETAQKAMHERSLDLIAQYDRLRGVAEAKAEDDTIKGIQNLGEVKKKAAEEQLRNAHLSGQDLTAAEQALSNAIVAINEETNAKVAKAKEKLQKIQDAATKSELQYIDANQLAVAKLNDDKIKELELTKAAELKIIRDKYDEEVKIAKKAGHDIAALTASRDSLIAAKEKDYSKKSTALQGGYTDNLMQDLHDRMQSQGNMSKQMADMTMSAADQVASGLATMAVNGKMSMQQLALSVIQSIEMMIAKMLVMKAISMMMGGLGGLFGGATSGIQEVGTASLGQATSSGAMSSAITPSFSSFQKEGGLWSSGVQLFAEGGVVNQPTPFQHAGGLGLMGEAGPEAIVPLSKGRSIPVEISGKSGGTQNIGQVQIVIQSKNDKPSEDGKDAAKAFHAQMKSIAQQEISSAMRPGNRLNPINR
jgi:lambda family phage tail tape measure protein